MHKYEVALMMNEKRLTNSFKSYIGLDDDEQVSCFFNHIGYPIGQPIFETK